MKTEKSRSALWLLFFVVLVFLTLPARVSGQLAFVKKIQAETEEGLSVGIWLTQREVKLGQDIIVHYSVKNNGSQTIYMVSEDPPDITTDRSRILIGEPMPTAASHGEYNFHFHIISRGQTFQSKIIIPGNKCDKARRWSVDVGFAYVTDITGLDRRLEPGEDPLTLRAPLFDRAKPFYIGGLNIDVVE